jgi:hypothetical protein
MKVENSKTKQQNKNIKLTKHKNHKLDKYSYVVGR